MILTHQRIDINACHEAGHAPQDIIGREPGDIWYVSNDALLPLDKKIEWACYKKHEHVMIPLVHYRISPEPDMALGMMFTIGARVVVDLGRPVYKLHVAIGNPVSDGSDDPEGQGRLGYWLGFGVVLQR
jgi:hypothetical protein